MSNHAILSSKLCPKCGVEKSLSEFYKRKDNKDGHYHICKKCCGKKTNKNRLKIYSCYTDNGGYHKVCNICGRLKSFNSFSKDTSKKDKLQSVCKECHKKMALKCTVRYDKNIWYKKKAKYGTKTANSIEWFDYIECSDAGFLLVKCKYCGKKFTPKNRDVDNRATALNIKGTDTQGLYCSSGCKKACPTYRQIKHYRGQEIDGSSREVQPELRQMCLGRDGYTCQKCGANGKTIQLHCHHIYPLNESPITSADVDNTITLCKSCHKEAHKIAGCNYNDLKCQ